MHKRLTLTYWKPVCHIHFDTTGRMWSAMGESNIVYGLSRWAYLWARVRARLWRPVFEASCRDKPNWLAAWYIRKFHTGSVLTACAKRDPLKASHHHSHGETRKRIDRARTTRRRRREKYGDGKRR